MQRTNEGIGPDARLLSVEGFASALRLPWRRGKATRSFSDVFSIFSFHFSFLSFFIFLSISPSLSLLTSYISIFPLLLFPFLFFFRISFPLATHFVDSVPHPSTYPCHGGRGNYPQGLEWRRMDEPEKAFKNTPWCSVHLSTYHHLTRLCKFFLQRLKQVQNPF